MITTCKTAGLHCEIGSCIGSCVVLAHRNNLIRFF